VDVKTIGRVADRPESGRLTLEEAFAAYYERVLRLSFLLTGDREIAEDLAQETFVRVVGRIHQVDPPGALAYLRRTTVNLAKNRIRRASLERRLRQRSVHAESVDPSAGVDRHIVLWDTVTRLPRRQRTALVLRYYEELTEEETARVMDCSVGTVKSNVSRALLKLRKVMRDENRG
jgi:RNA polymerase sigma-70 factor (sigma-E family)